MFDDVDESLRALLVADVPIDPAEVDISFDRPARDWSSRLSRPTLNLFLFDIRERTDFRDDTPRVRERENGAVVRERPPRRVDLSYLVTAWTREPDDEHRILGRVLASLYRNLKLDEAHLKGRLREGDVPVLLRAMSPDHVHKAVDFWGVMDNELRAGLTWVVTAPLYAFGPTTGPMVLTKEIQVGPKAGPERRSWSQVGGIVHRRGDPAAPVAGTSVAVVGSTRSATTDSLGRFTFARLSAGPHVLRVEAPGSAPFDHPITVPSTSYDIEIPGSQETEGGARRSTRARS